MKYLSRKIFNLIKFYFDFQCQKTRKEARNKTNRSFVDEQKSKHSVLEFGISVRFQREKNKKKHKKGILRSRRKKDTG